MTTTKDDGTALLEALGIVQHLHNLREGDAITLATNNPETTLRGLMSLAHLLVSMSASLTGLSVDETVDRLRKAVQSAIVDHGGQVPRTPHA